MAAGSADLFRNIFGSLSGGLGIFANNPFRKKEPENQKPPLPDDGSKESKKDARKSRSSGAAQVSTPSVEQIVGEVAESQMEKEKGQRHRKKGGDPDVSELIPEMELVESRKRSKKANQANDTANVRVPDEIATEQHRQKRRNEDGASKNMIKKKKRRDNVPLSSEGVILGDESNPEQADEERRPGTPDGSHEKISARPSKKEKRAQDGLDQTVPRKRLKGSVFEEHTTLGFVGTNVPVQGAETRQTSENARRKRDVAPSGTKRKREDDIEDRYEKKMKGLNLLPTSEELPKNLQENTKDEPKAEDHNLLSKKRKRNEDEGEGTTVRTFDDDEKLRRTVFVGNLTLKVKKKAILREFAQYGAVESVRLRSVPLLDTKVPRKGAVITGKINEAIDSQHAYIVFKEEMSANAALAHNMKEFNGNHIRVDAAHAPHGALKGKSFLSYDRSRSIFVGNVPFDVKDEELYQVFTSGKTLEMDIEAIRVVRDPKTSLSKGIAFLLFKTKAAASKVLSLKKPLKLRDRILRISRVLATQTEPNVKSTKRWRDEEGEEDRSQKKRAKLSASYEGTRATRGEGLPVKGTTFKTSSMKNQTRSSKDHSNNPGKSHPKAKKQVVAARKTPSKGAQKFAGSKRKRVEKHQRGISRSKKIRRG